MGKARLKYAIEESKRILGIPEDYLLGIVSRELNKDQRPEAALELIAKLEVVYVVFYGQLMYRRVKFKPDFFFFFRVLFVYLFGVSFFG